MDTSEIYVLFQQQGVGKSPKEPGFNKVLDAIQSISAKGRTQKMGGWQ